MARSTLDLRQRGLALLELALDYMRSGLFDRAENLFLELQLKGAPIHVSSVVPGYVKSAIFAANARGDEPADAARHRQTMQDMMQDHGMDANEAGRVILAGVAAGHFWVSTQPETTAQMIAGRIAYLQNQSDPPLSAATRALVGL